MNTSTNTQNIYAHDWDDWSWYSLHTVFANQPGIPPNYYQSYRDIAGSVYFITGDGVTEQKIPQADAQGFKIAYSISSGVGLNWAKDASRVYWKYSPLSGADPQTFTPLFDASGALTYFGKDKSHVYYQNLLIAGADVKTFVVPATNSGPYNTSSAGHDAYTDYDFGTQVVSPNPVGSVYDQLDQRSVPVGILDAASSYLIGKLGKAYFEANLILSVRDTELIDTSSQYLVGFVDTKLDESLNPIKPVKYFITVNGDSTVDISGTEANNRIPDCVDIPSLCDVHITQSQAEDIATAASGFSHSSMMAGDIVLRAGSVTLHPNETCNQQKSVSSTDGWFWDIEFPLSRGIETVEVNAATGAVNICADTY